MTELGQNFRDVVYSILEELGIDYAQYDFTDTVDGGRYELVFKIQSTYIYLELGIFDFSDYNIDIFTSTRDEIKSAIIEMNNEVKDQLRDYQKEINKILDK